VKRFAVVLCVVACRWPTGGQSELPPLVLQLAELKRNIKTRLESSLRTSNFPD